MFQAIMNTPGYLPWADELVEFETAREAWEYLRTQREGHLDDPMNDEPEGSEDDAVEEMTGFIDEPQLGTVWGPTPGHDGDHDLGIAYSVIGVTYASKVRPPNSLCAWIIEANMPGLGIEL